MVLIKKMGCHLTKVTKPVPSTFDYLFELNLHKNSIHASNSNSGGGSCETHDCSLDEDHINLTHRNYNSKFNVFKYL